MLKHPSLLLTVKPLRLKTALYLCDLIHRFEWCVGSRHKEAFTALFADDAVFDHAVGYARGKQEAVDLAWTVPSYGLRHLFTNHVPFIDEQGRLCMISPILVIQTVSEQPVSVPFPAILDQGITRWVFQKKNGEWKFAEIVFEQHKLAAFAGAPESLYRAMAQTPAQRANTRATASFTQICENHTNVTTTSRTPHNSQRGVCSR